MALTAPAALAAQEQPAAPAVPPTPPTVFSSNRVIVEWAPGASHADRVDARNDAEVDFTSDLGNRGFQLVEVESGQTASDAIQALKAGPAVAVAERDSYSAPNAIPNDPLFGQLWGLRNTSVGINGFAGAVAGADISAPAAWDRTVGTATTVVADIDTGYRFEHPDLENVAWTNTVEASGTTGVDDDGNGIVDDIHGADFVGNNGEAPTIDGNPTDEDLLSGGHGVHTAGTMGAQGNNGIGITGVAQNARIMPLRVCSRFPSLEDSRCPVSSQVAAINYAAAKGASVANMSLGGTSFSQATVNAIAAAKETLFVISAGNDNEDNDSIHHYPCDYTPQTQASPSVPGAIDNIVCVAATDQADGRASFSDWGATSVDLGAPGTETLSTYPYATPFEDTFT
ncbi:MAG TPA: S8 family serine peptidase, partial [Solirubrobacterales bacterium]|nr:S8 family serine peptidase [Solirubrobacterales bacterium]